jgi:hypothetical protein
MVRTVIRTPTTGKHPSSRCDAGQYVAAPQRRPPGKPGARPRYTEQIPVSHTGTISSHAGNPTLPRIVPGDQRARQLTPQP